jgi:phosphoglycolate phosphatase
MPAPTLVIFDLDGTLADSFPWFVRVLNDVADEFRFRRITDDEIPELRRCGPRELLARLEVPLWKVPAIARHMRRLKAKHLHEIPLFPGAADMIRALSDAGIRLALVSSDHEANVRRQLGEETASRFQHFDCGAALFGKSAKFTRVRTRANAKPQETLAIGDEIRDIEAARAAKIRCGAVTWGYADAAALRTRNPDHVFETMDEIVAMAGVPPR